MSKKIQFKDAADNIYPIAPAPAWTYVGHSSGQSSVSLPSSGWTELYISINTTKGDITYIIPKIALDSYDRIMHESVYLSSTDFLDQQIIVNTSTVRDAEVYYYHSGSGSGVISWNDFYVYVR